MNTSRPHKLHTQWFDGRSPQGQAAVIWVEDQTLVIEKSSHFTRFPIRRVRWPERQRHGHRQTILPGGSVIHHANVSEWDAWWQAQGGRHSWVVGWQQSWHATALAIVMTVAFLAGAWVWGVPLLSKGVVALVPQSWEQALGKTAQGQLDSMFLEPSQVPDDRQAQIRSRMAQLTQTAYPQGNAPTWSLEFHRSKALGPNAFALPGGTVVVTDELIALLDDQPDALQGVLAHELGHVKHRDGLDMMVRASMISALIGVVFGDVSSVLTVLPATLLTQAYSREAERAADQHAAEVLAANGIPPAVMVVFFERIQKLDSGQNEATDLPISISSHPDHDERIQFFQQWAQPR